MLSYCHFLAEELCESGVQPVSTQLTIRQLNLKISLLAVVYLLLPSNI